MENERLFYLKGKDAEKFEKEFVDEKPNAEKIRQAQIGLEIGRNNLKKVFAIQFSSKEIAEKILKAALCYFFKKQDYGVRLGNFGEDEEILDELEKLIENMKDK
jgi:hypothetical protein